MTQAEAMAEYFKATGKAALLHWFEFMKWWRQQERKKR